MPLHPLVALSLAVGLCAQGPSVPVPALQDLLPPSTYASVHFRGLAACRAAAAELPLASVVQKFLGRLPVELRQQQIDPALDRAAMQLRRGLQQAGIAAADLQAIAARPMTLAVGKMTIEGMGPSVALLIDPGEALPAIQRAVAAMRQQIPERAARAAESAAIGGASLSALQFDDGPMVFFGELANKFVICNSRGFLKECAEMAVLPGTNGAAAATRAQDGALATLAIQLASINRSLAPHLPYEADAYADALGVGALDQVQATLAADAQGGVDRFEFTVGGNKRGLLKSALAPEVDLAFASACSANTVVFAAGSLDLPAVVDAFGKFLQLLPAEARTEMQREIGRDLEWQWQQMGTTGAEVDANLRAFGNQVGMALGLEKGPVPKPELLVRLQVRDAARVNGLLQRLEAITVREGQVEWKARRVDDAEIRFCSVPLAEAGLALSPSYALHDGALWIASDVAALVRALKQGGEQALTAQADYPGLQKLAKGASGVLHLRLDRAVEIGWRSVETLLYPQLDQHREQVGFGSDALPDQSTLAKALGHSTFVWRVDDQRVALESHGTLTFGSLLAAMGLLADTVLGRAAAKVY